MRAGHRACPPLWGLLPVKFELLQVPRRLVRANTAHHDAPRHRGIPEPCRAIAVRKGEEKEGSARFYVNGIKTGHHAQAYGLLRKPDRQGMMRPE